jgi:hypothetical protein
MKEKTGNLQDSGHVHCIFPSHPHYIRYHNQLKLFFNIENAKKVQLNVAHGTIETLRKVVFLKLWHLAAKIIYH